MRGRGRPRTTGTGHRGARVAVSPETVAQLDELARDGETRPQVVARIINDAARDAGGEKPREKP